MRHVDSYGYKDTLDCNLYYYNNSVFQNILFFPAIFKFHYSILAKKAK